MALVIGNGDTYYLQLVFAAEFNYGDDNDIVFGSPALEYIITGSGDDTIYTGLGGGPVWAGDGDDWVRGGSANDQIHAEAGDDLYIGGAGFDTLDFQLILWNNDGIIYNNDGVTFDLAKTDPQYNDSIGWDQAIGFEAINGSYGDDFFFGTRRNDGLFGERGNDELSGREGDDTLTGWFGSDTMIGGLGADRISCFDPETQVEDRVVYESLRDSGVTSATRDVIDGFVSGVDTLDFSALDARPSTAGSQAFKVVTKFTRAEGEIRLVYSGDDTIIQVDGDTDTAVDMTILVKGAHVRAFDLDV